MCFCQFFLFPINHWQFFSLVTIESDGRFAELHLHEQNYQVSEGAQNINLKHVIEGASDASSHEVSQSVPQSGLSPVLAKYKQYLQSCYNARVLAPADKYFPTLEAPYINLAMIRRGHCNHEQRDEFTRRTLHGGVDQILENKTPINIEDLLTPEDRDERYQMKVEGGEWLMHEGRENLILGPREDFEIVSVNSEFPERSNPLSERSADIRRHKKELVHDYSEVPVTEKVMNQTTEGSKKPVKFILVEGPPGIGKSTFAWEVCRRWDELHSLRDYHTVVLLKLREKWVLNAASLSDLFRFPFEPGFSKDIAEELYNSLGVGLLLVLDGFDEVSHSFHENSVIKSILCRQLLPECTIILTTRPVAKATLESICQPRVGKHVEIIGFTEEERVRYITEVFSKEPELQVNFLKYMFHVPHIKSMMYIPLNCAIIAQVYYESQSSHHLAIPRTRTQLYKALTHSLLVRHMKTKESNYEYTFMLPKGLDKENRKAFKTLAKFSFDTYHKGYLRKVTFFKEDIPEGLVHFGFMNESTEMYAGKGVEQILSFLHLSLQEYLAAWHLADSYSIEFQVAYHRLAVDSLSFVEYKGKEKALISSLQQQRYSLAEPAIFLAGITGWRCQSEDDKNHWEMYLSNDTIRVGNPSVLLQSLYEAQNASLCPYYFADCDDSWREFFIGSFLYHAMPVLDRNPHTPYDCYAFSYCLANSSDQLCYSLLFGFNNDNDISLVETFVKGANDHCLSTTPRVKNLKIEASSPSLVDRGLLWLMRANFLATVEESVFDTTVVNNSGAEAFLASLLNLKSLIINESHLPITSLVWLVALKSLSKLKVLRISSRYECSSFECSPPLTDLCWLIEHTLTEVMLDISPFQNELIYHYDQPSQTDILVDAILKSVLRSNQMKTIILFDLSCETMAGVHSILLHCPSLTTMVLKRTRLGYDGILYICSALKNNTTLRHLVIHDDLQLPPSRNYASTNLQLELSNIVKDNRLEVMNIYQSHSFLTSGGMIYDLQLYDNISCDDAHKILQTVIKMQLPENIEYCEWVASPESLQHLQKLHVSTNKFECDSEVNVLRIEFPMITTTPDICNTVDTNLNLVLKLVLQLNRFSWVALSNVSSRTLAGVHNILLHCPSLTTLELKRTRLGYDGILYICSALRNNTTLKHISIHNDLQPQPSIEYAILQGKTACSDLLLELSRIVAHSTLESMNIQSDYLCAVGDEERIIYELQFYNITKNVARDIFRALVKIRPPKNHVIYCDWIAFSPQHLKILHISNKSTSCIYQVSAHNNLSKFTTYSECEAVLDMEFHSTAIFPDHCNPIVDLLLQCNIVKVVLFNISHETMASIHNILLHCPSLTTLELMRTRLGYDGILYICSALRNNTTLRHLVIYDLQFPPSRDKTYFGDIQFTTFSSMERVPLPGKTTCTDFLLELNNILKYNTTLEVMKIQSGLFLPLSAGEDGEYCQWTGLGPLQQFNVGAVGSGMTPNLRRSFSSSDLTQPETTLFWDRQFPPPLLPGQFPFIPGPRPPSILDRMFGYSKEVDFKKLFSKRKEKGKKLFSLPSFTAPDTEVLQSFSGLDPRLKECLEISHLCQNVETLSNTGKFSFIPHG